MRNNQPVVANNYFEISYRFKEARQMFRLFKSLFEIKRMQLIVGSNSDRFSRLVNITSRAFYCLHYVLENIYIVVKACNIKKSWLSLDRLRVLSRRLWCMGLALFLVYCCKVLRQTYTDESDLKVATLNRMTVK